MKTSFLFILLILLSLGTTGSILSSDQKSKRASSEKRFSIKKTIPDKKTISGQKKISSEKTVNLSGHLKELIIPIGFPDRDTAYPAIKRNDKFPPLGAFPDGTLLSDYISAHGGSVPADIWYKPALNRFFSVYSGGKYNVDFDFLKRPDGKMYLTTDSLQIWIRRQRSSDDVIWNNWREMTAEVSEQIYKDDPHAFDSLSAIHFVFTGMNKTEFNTLHGGTVEMEAEIRGPHTAKTYYKGPVSIQREVNAIAHERMHIIGRLAGTPMGFNGFPDRGFDIVAGEGHTNLLYGYDMMYHNASIVSEHSLFGYPPIISHDLIFLGWIKPEEVLVIDKDNFKNYGRLKLSDVNYALSEDKLNQGFKRLIKVMIKENYSSNLDEYFLIEFHNATEFDKNFSNYDEYPLFGYNKGILIWHVKEQTPVLNTYSDNLIDLETAVPYNGFYGKPLPDDNYPRDYIRPEHWNGNLSGEYDYLDDGKMENSGGQWIFRYLPDGGRSNWEITTKGLDWTWYPPDNKIFPRLESQRSDFFSSEIVKGHLSNKFTDATRPSSVSWGGNYGNDREKPGKTHIAVTDIRHEKDYMTLNVFFNYWEGEIKENSEMEGNVIIGSDLIVPDSLALTIKPGAHIKFLNNSRLIVNGTLSAAGTSKKKITFDFRQSGYTLRKGIVTSPSSKTILKHTKVKTTTHSLK